MKILHISKNWFTTKVYSYLYGQLARYVDQKVIAIVPNSSKITSRDTNIDVYNSLYTKLYGLYSLKVLIIYLSIKKKFKEKYFSYDLMHAHFLYFDGDVAYRLFKKFNKPYLLTVRGSDIFIFQKRKYLKKRGLVILQDASKIVFISKCHFDYLMDCFSYDPMLKDHLRKKSLIIPNGIEDFWHKNRFYGKKLIINKTIKVLTVAGIDSNKNHVLVAESIKSLIDCGYNFEYLIIGNILDKKVYNNLLNYDFIRFIPNLDNSKLIDYYRFSDIFVMPSFFETFGLVYIEAISQGLPVIFSRNQGIDGLFNEKTVGRAINPNSQEELVDAIKIIIQDFSLMSMNKVDLSDFKWDVVGKKHYEMYKTILK